MMKKITALSIVLFLVFALPMEADSALAATPSLMVQGQITRSDGSPIAQASVQLLEISMSERPTIVPLLSGVTNQTGNYRLNYSPPSAPSEKVFYRISVAVSDTTIGSDPFRLKSDGSAVEINLTIPDRKEGFQYLEIPKEIVIIEAMEEKLRLTNILFIVNSTGAVVNAKKIPFEKPIHNQAYNIQNMERQDDLLLDAKPGKMLIGLTMPEGTRQVFFSYDIPVSGGKVQWEYQLFPGLQEIEFTTPDKEVAIAIDPEGSAGYSIISQTKTVGSRLFYSKIVSLETARDSISISIGGVPLGQKYLIVPAAFLLALLLGGLLVYLVKRRAY